MTLKVNFTKWCSLYCLAKFYILYLPSTCGRCTGLITDTSALDPACNEKETFTTSLGRCVVFLDKTLLKNLFPPKGIHEFCPTISGKLQNSGRRRNAPGACPSQEQRWHYNISLSSLQKAKNNVVLPKHCRPAFLLASSF